MIPNGSVEEGVLHVRINELERRLAQLEKQMSRASPQAAEVKRVAAEAPELPPRNGNGVSKQPDEGLEGARLVAIELLSSGYAREEVANYLSSTFGVADADAVSAGTGLVPG